MSPEPRQHKALRRSNGRHRGLHPEQGNAGPLDLEIDGFTGAGSTKGCVSLVPL
jgi:hypothetical protein